MSTSPQPHSGVLATIPSAAVFDHWNARIDGMDHTEAWQALDLFQRWDVWLSHAQTDLRFRLGQLLSAIQKRKLFLEMGATTWADFLNENAPQRTGLQRTVLYQALKIAGCESLIRLSDEQRAAIPISNANTIAALESANGHPVDPEVIANATSMPTSKFRQSVGSSSGCTVKVWVRDKAQAEPLERVLEVLKGCSPDNLAAFADVLHDDLVRAEAGDGPDNILDHVLSHYGHSWRKELDERNAEEGRVHIPDIDHYREVGMDHKFGGSE